MTPPRMSTRTAVLGRAPADRLPTSSTTATAPTSRAPRARRGVRLGAIGACLLALVVGLVLSVGVGSRPIPPGDVLRLLLHPDGTQLSYIVWDYRVPRTVLAVAVGAALSVAGALMQALTRNPLADPGLLGVEAGAVFAIAAAIVLLGVTSLQGYVWFAFAGSAASAVLVYLLGASGRGGASPARLALAGMAVTAALASTTQALVFLDRAAFVEFQHWGTGALVGQDVSVLVRLAPFLGAGLVIALLLGGPLNALALGDEAGRALGTRPGVIRAWGGLAITVLCGAATAAVGPIGFIGLIVAHAARLLAGPDNRRILLWCLLLGPTLLLYSDVLGRLVLWPDELQAGVVTALIGAPLFIALVRRGKVARL